MIKALFFDIDGTLVSFNTHAIPQSTIDAIELAKEKGVKVFISTGRPKVIINNLGNLTFDGYITMNGSYCYVGEKVIYKCRIPQEDVQAMAEIVKRDNIPCVFVEENRMNVCNSNEKTEEFQRTLKIPSMTVATIEEVVTKEIFQMSPFITVEQEKTVMSSLPHCSAGRWCPIFADVVAVNTGKEKGIDEIIKYFGFDLEETMSFGDGGNDINMLRHVAIGVAMGNAAETVKQAADYVTTSVDNDGVMNALKHFNII
ncbi:putative bifunctional phosphatase/peptidyl-prolyl cis-trans isomerase [termite gut metagenome]|uniref:Putative bifunctional phosphatase/peptidyl-prolyl cis-trans isomerase n=1 Tax=termite gut metagenome TaxID=433724 RepID=A0A5J4S7K4_9ZZZZ